MSVLYLVRHGQASFGGSDYDRLSPLGERQAALTGRFWADSGVKLDAAFCGDMRRQRKSGELALSAWASPPELATDPHFNEYPFQRILAHHAPRLARENEAQATAVQNMKNDREAFKLVFNQSMKRWLSGEPSDGSMESAVEFKDRVNQGLLGLQQRLAGGQKVAVFTSGGPIALAVQRALNLDLVTTLKTNFLTRNCSISTFFLKPGKFSLVCFNSTGHLESAGDPSLITFR